ncbi:MAG: hypothetical protein HQM02_12015, partial [Magnetococcales bacterium]|nr:hypothetical protein [Magnetococcales bacterium]
MKTRALALYAAGQVEQALSVAEAWMTSRGPDPVLLNLAAACHMGLGDWERADACW